MGCRFDRRIAERNEFESAKGREVETARSRVGPGQVRPPTISHGEWVGCIGVQAMVLMERPTVVHEAHRARIHEATNRQMEVVKGDMYAEQRPGDRAGGISNIQDRSARRVSTGGPILPADDDD